MQPFTVMHQRSSIVQSTASAHSSATIHKPFRDFLAKDRHVAFHAVLTVMRQLHAVLPAIVQSAASAYASVTIHKLFVTCLCMRGKRSAIRLQSTAKPAASSYSLGTNRRRGLACLLYQ
jgi:hypothetical protein